MHSRDHASSEYIYKGRSINKFKNGVILLVFKIGYKKSEIYVL